MGTKVGYPNCRPSEVGPMMNTTSHGGKGRKKNQASMASPDEGRKDKKGRENWKDAWVMQLIHICGTMHDDFGKPPKQDVDLWSKVVTQLASLFPECDKDDQACSKKTGTRVRCV
ncbi:hypothetical protein GOP47_0023225 [Adiantum capillus-veneris]|uniref:Uncharacterized protein n=1 Tax=Adiantum capillus-veneris TaxID=13818 RepID=A0A9D4U977_ADICA|nr:hypothetical protein GOP47_0023225 [Adiantum capillus-veneris]